MLLLFAGGVMNLLWVAALAAFVFIEKLVPYGQWSARVSGVAMLAFGVYLMMGG
jgi:predicted metal-binding membrane protein